MPVLAVIFEAVRFVVLHRYAQPAAPWVSPDSLASASPLDIGPLRWLTWATVLVLRWFGDPHLGTHASWQVLYLLNCLPNSRNPILVMRRQTFSQNNDHHSWAITGRNTKSFSTPLLYLSAWLTHCYLGTPGTCSVASSRLEVLAGYRYHLHDWNPSLGIRHPRYCFYPRPGMNYSSPHREL